MAKKVNSNFVVLLTLQKSKETNKVYSAVTVLHSTLWTTVKYTEAKSNWFFNCNNHVQRFLPKPRLGSQWNSFFVSLIEEPHFHKNGAGGRFSHLRVGKIFDIYLCNMKNSTVKAINRSNTDELSLLCCWVPNTNIFWHYCFWRGEGGGSDVVDLSWQQPKSTHFSSQFHQVKFLPTALNTNKIPPSVTVYKPLKAFTLRSLYKV